MVKIKYDIYNVKILKRGRMFFSKYKNDVIDKSNALVGRDNPIIDKLSHEINGRDLMLVPKGFSEILFGMGCFWGAERKFWTESGVVSTAVGYAGGHLNNPTYQDVCTGMTGHAEGVLLLLDSKSYSKGQNAFMKEVFDLKHISLL